MQKVIVFLLVPALLLVFSFTVIFAAESPVTEGEKIVSNQNFVSDYEAHLAEERLLQNAAFQEARSVEQTLEFDPPPLLLDGETMIPLKTFCEYLDMEVSWSEQTRTVTVKDETFILRFPAENGSVYVNGAELETDYSSKIIEGHAYISLNMIMGILDPLLEWEQERKEMFLQQVEEQLEEYEVQETAHESNVSDDSNKSEVAYSTKGVASWYGGKFHGRNTASGEVFNQNDYTAAHRELPFGTKVRITFLGTGESVKVRINDRGPHISGRIIDLSRRAAEDIGLKPHGIGTVEMQVLK